VTDQLSQHPATPWVLVSILVLTWWLSQPDEGGLLEMDDPTARLVDYYVRDFRVTDTDINGQPTRILDAEEMRHYPSDDTTELELPELTIFRTDQPWTIVSEKGWLSGDGKLMLLSGEVVIDRQEGENNSPIRLLTSNLRVQPKQDYAETDEKVRVTSLDDRIDAVGMQAWFRKPGRIKFLSEVKGHYVPR